MNNSSALLLFTLLLAACSSASQSTEANNLAPSGIEGTVTMGPMCPVVQENVPCPDAPFQGTFSILTAEGDKVTEFQTDKQGRFRISLAAGDYVLRLESPQPMRSTKDTQFSVTENKYTSLEITLDSGIR